MIQGKQTHHKILSIVVCAAVPARHIQEFILLAQAAQWQVHVIATPNASGFIDRPLLTQITGHAVLIDEDEFASLPPCDVLIVVPATFNTLKKWAQGVIDNGALKLLYAGLQSNWPTLVVPRATPELAQDPAFGESVQWLRDRGVHVLYEPEIYPPNNAVPWVHVFAALQQIACQVE